MITAFSNRDGRVQQVTAPLRDAMWIDLLNATEAESTQVAAETGLAIPTEQAIDEIESSSRLATHHGALYLTMPLVVQPEAEPRSASIGFVLTPERLITIRFAISRVFDHFMEALRSGDAEASCSVHVLIGILEAIVDRQADVLEHVRNELEAISHSVFSKDMAAASGRKREDATLRATLVTLGRVGDLVSHVRESQVSASRIVPYLETTAAAWLPKDLVPRLHTLRRDIASLNDFATHLSDKLQFLLDATLGFINIAQNNVMKVLTVVSVVGIPPVLIAGIYGMNFKNMPEYDWSFGYAYGLGLILLTTLIPLGIFKWRNWI